VVVPTSGLVVVEPLEVVVAVVTVVAEVVAVEEVIAVAAGCVPEVETGALGGIVPSSVEAPCWVDVERCPPPLSWPAGAGGGADSRAGSANHAAATPAAPRVANAANAFCLRLYDGVMPCVSGAVASVGAWLGIAASSASNKALPSGGRLPGSFVSALATSVARRAGASGR
jgi:hypothetical protein